MEELEKKMEGMKAMMLDWFSGVDKKLIAIEERLKKIVDTQNQIGNQLERFNENVIEKDMEEEGIELNKNRDKGKAVEIRGCDGGSSNEHGPKTPWRARISRDDDNHYYNLGQRQGRQGLQWECGNPHGWVGLYTHHYGKHSPQGTAWMSQLESDFRQIERLPFGEFKEGTAVKGKFVDNSLQGWPGTKTKQVVETDESLWAGKKSENDDEKGFSSFGKKAIKTGQDEISKGSIKADSSGKVADKSDAGGEEEEEEEEEQMRSLATCGNTKDDKTDASPQDSLKPVQQATNHSSFGFEAMQNEINGESGGSMVANEGSNEKGHEEGHKLGSRSWKEEGLGGKRKQPDSPVEGRNDGLRSREPLTATRQRLNVFTSDEQEILKEIEPVMQSISRIMRQDG